MLRLSEIKDRDWAKYRRVARRYERDLKRIRDATACTADHLRKLAAEAVNNRKKQRS